MELNTYNHCKIIFVPLQVPGHLIIQIENCWTTATKGPSHATHTPLQKKGFYFGIMH